MAARHARQPAVSRAVAPGDSSDFTAPATDGVDWRVSVYLNVPGAAPRRRRALSAYEVQNELRQRVRGRVVLQTHDRDVVFVYTRTQDAAAAAQQAVSDLLAERSIPAQVVVERWHPIAEQWELPEAPLPADEAAERAERTLLDAAETRESMAFGAAMYDVRVKLPSHREVVELAASLEAEGYSVVRRSRFLIVGANNADQAAEFEAAIRQQAPEGAELSVESHINPNPPRYDP